METAPLKSFATSARTELIREVGARVTAVLAQGSAERVEQPKAVTALERAIAGAGGGDKGKAHVADKVAYTWFNRIIALRFMDANGYTGVGVVSPAADQVGQPEVLAAAKRGQLDKDVVKGANPATITGLLNGTRQPRPGADAQAEAYALLLADYCRFWNTAMPFMFEREGDYTELLIPANLLADDSVLSRSVAVLTEDVCRDVEVIGWLYQFYISERKDEVFAGFKKNKKAGVDEIPAATQLFTPHWIVRYLVENSLGRLWMLNRPSSGLASQMDYYIAPVDEETDFLKISKPEELKVIDPACGSGHMLTYAFDLLYVIYQEEGYAPSEIPGLILANNLYGTEIDPRAGALAAFALTMKAASKRKLFLKNPVEPNICVIDPISFTADELSYLVTKDGNRHAEEAFWNQFAEADTFGSLIKPDPALVQRLKRHLDTVSDGGDMLMADTIERAGKVVDQATFLTSRYSVVVANPPYMGNASMGALLSDFAKSMYPSAKTDLFAMFIERNLALSLSRGLVGMVTMHSWMFLRSYRAFRTNLMRATGPVAFAHLGTRAFAELGGEVVSTVAFVVSKGSDPHRQSPFERLVDLPSSGTKNVALQKAAIADTQRTFRHSWEELGQVPDSVLSYWLPDGYVRILADQVPLAKRVLIMAGISTGDNGKYFRFWPEVSMSRIHGNETERPWAPHHKGGPERRWAGNVSHVLRYDSRSVAEMQKLPGFRHDGNANYFKAHVGWSALTGGAPSFRYIDDGHTYGSGSKALVSDRANMLRALGVLNSVLAAELLEAMSPTLNFEVGHIGLLPTVPQDAETDLEILVERAVALAMADWDESELSMGFTVSPLVAPEARIHSTVDLYQRRIAERAGQLAGLEERIESEVRRIFSVDLTETARRHLADTAGPAAPARELVGDLVSYAVGCMFGRYSLDEPGLILADQGATLQDYLVKVPTPTFTPDADNVIPIVDGDWFEDDVVALFRRFLRTAFGAQHFEENLKFVTESLSVRNLRDYFITRAGRSKFYEDHVQRYKKRPIYWLFSSPKGSFNALIYMHRYTPSALSTVLTYLREYVTKLESALRQAERAGNAKEADRLRKILVELNEYEHDTLYPKASENVVIDLDDGVKTNYPRFGASLKKITGLEASGD
ncbi:BREX-1 system adenine-specific DNA-methyltransferase PglX [Georgenia muralis]